MVVDGGGLDCRPDLPSTIRVCSPVQSQLDGPSWTVHL